jgi:hypothetical protein
MRPPSWERRRDASDPRNCARVNWNGDGFDYENEDDDEDETRCKLMFLLFGHRRIVF